MTTEQIANSLVELCRKGDFDTAQKELFSDDAVSIESHATPAFEKETRGLQAIKKREKNGIQWCRKCTVLLSLIHWLVSTHLHVR
nr:SnoaL-like domain-containing protein [Hydrotalea sp.]